MNKKLVKDMPLADQRAFLTRALRRLESGEDNRPHLIEQCRADLRAVAKQEVNGEEHTNEQGQKVWMGSVVHPCPACGVAPTNVDDCGHFGDPMCPAFGVGYQTIKEK